MSKKCETYPRICFTLTQNMEDLDTVIRALYGKRLKADQFAALLSYEYWEVEDIVTVVSLTQPTNLDMETILGYIKFDTLLRVFPVFESLQSYGFTFDTRVLSRKTRRSLLKDARKMLRGKFLCEEVYQVIYTLWSLCEEVAHVEAIEFKDVACSISQCLGDEGYLQLWKQVKLKERVMICGSCINQLLGTRTDMYHRMVNISGFDEEVRQCLDPQSDGIWDILEDHIKSVCHDGNDFETGEIAIRFVYQLFDVDTEFAPEDFLETVGELWGYESSEYVYDVFSMGVDEVIQTMKDVTEQQKSVKERRNQLTVYPDYEIPDDDYYNDANADYVVEGDPDYVDLSEFYDDYYNDT